MPVIDLDGETIAYTVRHSQRAKRIFVRISPPCEVEVVYPAGEREPAPDELLRGKSNRIVSRLRRYRQANANRFRRRYLEGESFLIRGKTYPLRLRYHDALCKASVRANEVALELTLPAGTDTDDLDMRRDAVVQFYRDLAHFHLPARVAELALEFGFSYNSLRIKHQKTRWGSCSAKGNINLNLRLMMAPTEAIDYVIIHELCHLRELNHSKQFWTHVEICCPQFRKRKAWFQQHQAQLVL